MKRRTFLATAPLIGVAVAAGLRMVQAVPQTSNPIVEENNRTGTTDWQLNNPATNREIEGYASATSVNRGGTLLLFVNTSASSYSIEVFRMGWYDGAGARRVFGPVSATGTSQVIATPDGYGMVDNNWVNPYSLTLDTSGDPENWPTGVYVARLTTSGSGKQSYILFVVRDDSRAPDLLYQLPVTTYQAYNNWGGKSLYDFNSTSNAPAYKVSFNRPYARSTNLAAAYGMGAGEFFTNVQPVAEGLPISSAGWNYNMVRFLEQSGYDVGYITNIDAHASPNLLLQPRAFLSVGHDEYWSSQMRSSVQAARDAGVNLGFFSANTCYWQIRMEASPATGVQNRVMVCYKGSYKADPYYNDGNSSNDKYVTNLWRSEPVYLPESALLGVQYGIDPVDADIIVTNASHWVYSNTGLSNGSRLSGLLGYEVDQRTGYEPSNTTTLATSQAVNLRTGEQFTSHMTIYSAPSGARVFSTGSIQWSWGLDDFNVPNLRGSRLSAAAQQITHNVLQNFGAVRGSSATPTSTPTQTPTPTQTSTPTPTFTPAPPAQIHYWHFDEAGSSTAVDQIGNRDGSLQNGAAWVSGQQGTGLQFNGASSIVRLSAVQNSDLISRWSVGVWVKRLGSTAASAIIASAVGALKLEQWQGTGKVGVTRYGVADYTYDYSVPLNQWVYLLFVSTGSQIKLYVDCFFKGAINDTLLLPLSTIGSDGAGDTINGILDELHIYNYALSELEISALCPVPPTSTPTATPTSTSTATPTPTSTSTPTATPTSTSTSTSTPTPTSTTTPMPAATSTSTQTPTPSTFGIASTATATSTPTQEVLSTHVPSSTQEPGQRIYLPVIDKN